MKTLNSLTSFQPKSFDCMLPAKLSELSKAAFNQQNRLVLVCCEHMMHYSFCCKSQFATSHSSNREKKRVHYTSQGLQLFLPSSFPIGVIWQHTGHERTDVLVSPNNSHMETKEGILPWHTTLKRTQLILAVVIFRLLE